MSAHDSYDDALAERARNEEYLRRVAEAADRFQDLSGRQFSRLANSFWGGGRAENPPPPPGVLIGRVALGRNDPKLADFYVAPRHVQTDSMLVIEWIAPIGGLFYEGRRWDPRRVPDPHTAPDPESLLARRTFESRGERITDFRDDLERGVDRSTVFRFHAPPDDIPAPPSVPSTREAQTPAGSLPARPPRTPTTPAAASADEVERHGDADSTCVDSGAPRVQNAAGRDPRALARAGDLVFEAIEEPRDRRLHSVLSTLQPDQYRCVTWPASEDLAVKGHPGTGKTIVAIHRAAYLTHPDHDRHEGGHQRLEGVGLIGPSDEWRSHVVGALDETGASGVVVISLENMIRRLAGDSSQPLHRDDERYFQTDWELGRIVDSTARWLHSRLKRRTAAAENRKLIFETIVHSDHAPDMEPERREWLRTARSYENARRDPSYLLLRACIGLVCERTDQIGRYQHLIVDEVQDLRPAEWWIIDKLRARDCRYSLFGDMEQRRADVTWSTWEELLDRLELDHDDGSPLEVTELQTGYRSNREILAFAARLLPRGAERRRTALRAGDRDAVRKRRVGPTRLLPAAFEEARSLTEEYPQGLVAVIGWNPADLDEIKNRFHASGWRRTSSEHRFLALGTIPNSTQPAQQVMLARPVDARGLEFDGVVVVEPAVFRKNLGRHGSLYTSFTRANKKLVVVYSRAGEF